MSKASEDNHTSEMMEEDDDSKIFPQRLMEILSNERFNEAICWLPHGRAFVIKNRKLFGETVMPRYFSRKAKYSSFTRKLNRWNFVRVSSGPEIGAYYHEFFLRDKSHLAAQMFCKNARSKLAMASVSENTTKAVPVVEQEAVGPAQLTPQQQILQPMNPSASFMAALRQKVPDNTNNQVKGSFPSYGNNTLQLLQRQMDVMQAEQAKRMELMQHERAQRMMLEHAVRQNSLLAPVALPQRQQQHPHTSRLLQMQQLMDMQMQQRQQPRSPTNPRASAA